MALFQLFRHLWAWQFVAELKNFHPRIHHIRALARTIRISHQAFESSGVVQNSGPQRIFLRVIAIISIISGAFYNGTEHFRRDNGLLQQYASSR
jgi:hypothetical protein